MSGEGINSHMTPMSKQSMSSMDMGYSGANNMANNGLSANQNQVRTEVKCCSETWACFNRELKTFKSTVKAAKHLNQVDISSFSAYFSKYICFSL